VASDEAEILEEIAFHLEMRTRDNVREGLEPEEARRAAEERFGSVEKVIGECLRVRNGGRVMLQRINLVMVVVLLAAVGGLGWMLVSDSARSADEMRELRGEIARLLEGNQQAALLDAAPDVERIHLLGQVNKPGTVPITGQITLGKAIALGGGFRQYAKMSAVRIIRKAGDRTRVIVVDFDEIVGGDRADLPLEPDDIVFVPESIF
jgi:hypothetical protein